MSSSSSSATAGRREQCLSLPGEDLRRAALPGMNAAQQSAAAAAAASASSVARVAEAVEALEVPAAVPNMDHMHLLPFGTPSFAKIKER